MKILLPLLAVSFLLAACDTMRTISQGGRKITTTIANNKDVIFDTFDTGINVAETLKTNVTGVFHTSSK